MDYIIGFLIGYYWHRFINKLRTLADNKVIKDMEWDWLSTNDPE